MEKQHHQHPLAKKAWRKMNTSTLSATAIASTSLASMSSGVVINIEQNLQCYTQSNLQQRISPIFLAKIHKVYTYSGKHH